MGGGGDRGSRRKKGEKGEKKCSGERDRQTVTER